MAQGTSNAGSIVEEKKYKGGLVTDYSPSGEDPKIKLQQDMTLATSLLRRTMRAAGIYNKEDMRYRDTFYRFKRIDPFHIIEGATEYLFFVKPDLNILDGGGDLTTYADYYVSDSGGTKGRGIPGGVATVPYFQELASRGYLNTVLADLCYSNSLSYGNNCPFVKMLSNRKTSNMDIPDIVVDELETAQNMYGSRIFYAKSSLKSDEDVEFTIDFEDTQYLEIYHFFKAYDIYRQLMWLGVVSPTTSHIENKILADHMSIFKFLIDTDGETILHYSKATGVFPKSINRSTFSEVQDRASVKITVTFKLSGWFEDMEPSILSDFNLLVKQWIAPNTEGKAPVNEAPIWDEEIGMISGEPVSYFYVTDAPGYMQDTPGFDSSGYNRYLLKGGVM